jgi:hypothetical protein
MTERLRRAMAIGMDDRSLISEVGLALWGPAWEGPMADALKQPKTSVSDWARGRTPVPAGVWKELREVTRLHGLKLADLGQEIVRNYDAAVALASKART